MSFTRLFSRKILSFDVLCIMTITLLVLVVLVGNAEQVINNMYSWGILLCVTLANGLYVAVLKYRHDKSDQISSLRQDKTELRTRLRKLQENSSRIQNEKVEVERRFVIMERENRTTAARRSQLDFRNEDFLQLERNAADGWRRYQEADEKVIFLERRLSEMTAKCQKLDAERVMIQQEKQQLESQSFSVREREMTRMKEMNDLRRELMRVNDLLEILDEKFQDSGHEINRAVKKLREADDLDDSGLGNDSSFIVDDNYLNDEVERVLSTLKNEKDNVNECKQELDARNQKICSLERDNQFKQTELERIKSENTEYKSVFKVVQGQMKSKDLKIEETRNKCTQYAMQVLQAKQQIDEMTRQVEEARLVIHTQNEFQKKVIELEDGFGQQQMQLKMYHEQLTKLTDEKQILVDKCTALEQEKEEKVQENSELVEKLTSLDIDLEKTLDEVTHLRETLEELRDEKDSLDEKCSVLEEEKEAMAQVKCELEEKLTSALTGLDKTRDELLYSKQKLEKLENVPAFKLVVNRQESD